MQLDNDEYSVIWSCCIKYASSFSPLHECRTYAGLYACWVEGSCRGARQLGFQRSQQNRSSLGALWGLSLPCKATSSVGDSSDDIIFWAASVQFKCRSAMNAWGMIRVWVLNPSSMDMMNETSDSYIGSWKKGCKYQWYCDQYCNQPCNFNCEG